MTPEAALRELAWRFSSADPSARILGSLDLRFWPEMIVSAAQAHGLLKEHTPAARVTCPACEDEHIEDIQWFEDDAGEQHAAVRCPTYGRAEVPAWDLRQWKLDAEGLARFLRDGLCLAGTLQTVVEDRVWTLGTAGLSGQPVKLIRGTGWSDGEALHVAAGDRNTVLIGSEIPYSADDHVIQLEEILRWDGTTLVVDDRPICREHVVREPASVAASYLFREGSLSWELAFGGRPFHVPDGKGLHDIHVLLGRPHESILAVDFVDSVKVESGLEMVDSRTLTELRSVLRRGGAGADAGAIRQYLNENTRPSGKPRKGASPFSLAATTVRNRITRSLAKIETSDPDMALHLRQSIETGITLRYQPTHQIDWVL